MNSSTPSIFSSVGFVAPCAICTKMELSTFLVFAPKHFAIYGVMKEFVGSKRQHTFLSLITQYTFNILEQGILSLHLGALLLIFLLFQKRTFPHEKSPYASNVIEVQFLTYDFLSHIGELLDFGFPCLHLLLILSLVFHPRF